MKQLCLASCDFSGPPFSRFHIVWGVERSRPNHKWPRTIKTQPLLQNVSCSCSDIGTFGSKNCSKPVKPFCFRTFIKQRQSMWLVLAYGDWKQPTCSAQILLTTTNMMTYGVCEVVKVPKDFFFFKCIFFHSLWKQNHAYSCIHTEKPYASIHITVNMLPFSTFTPY